MSATSPGPNSVGRSSRPYPAAVHPPGGRRRQSPAGLHGGTIVGTIVDDQLHPMAAKLGQSIEPAVPDVLKMYGDPDHHHINS